MLLSCDEIVTWYSDYYDDLPIVTDKNEFIKVIEDGLKDPCCEAYVWFKKVMEDKLCVKSK